MGRRADRSSKGTLFAALLLIGLTAWSFQREHRVVAASTVIEARAERVLKRDRGGNEIVLFRYSNAGSLGEVKQEELERGQVCVWIFGETPKPAQEFHVRMYLDSGGNAQFVEANGFGAYNNTFWSGLCALLALLSLAARRLRSESKQARARA